MKKVIVSLVLLAYSLALWFLKNVPGFADKWLKDIYLPLIQRVTPYTGMVPFSIAEMVLYLLILILVFDLFHSIISSFTHRTIRNFLHYLGRVLLCVSILLAQYVSFCGVNYKASSFAQKEGFPVTEENQSTENLKRLCTYLVREIRKNSTAASSLKENYEAESLGRAAMEHLGTVYPSLAGSYPNAKPVLVSRFLSVQQITGIYSPFTFEANYNREAPDYNIPFVICHELSHLRGFMQEDEANFIAFLACITSKDAYFRYAGYLSGWVYAGNALVETDPETFGQLYETLPECAKKDLEENNAFWDRFDTKAAEVHDQMNDTYLKANGQKEGIITYDMVVRLMLSWYDKGHEVS